VAAAAAIAWAKRSCPGAGMSAAKAIAGGRQRSDLRPRFSSYAARPPAALVGACVKQSIHRWLMARFSG